MRFLIVTGMSGAGKSNAIKSLEDIGYYCIDNMPARLINQFIDLSNVGKSEFDKVAFVIDIRGGEFFDEFETSIREISQRVSDLKILFLEASDEVLIRRYKETRRAHPMSGDGTTADGIKKERERLSVIRSMSNYVIDTSLMKPNELKRSIRELFGSDNVDPKRSVSLTVVSFGYKNGIPLDADLVFDVRFIPNPFYLKSMKNLTGNNHKVRDYVMKWEESQIFLDSVSNLILTLIPYYTKQDKNNLVIAFGCTGGQHRSVAMANEMEKLLTDEDYMVKLVHRDLPRA